MNIYRFFILLITLSFYSCVEKYDINITNKIDGVVIEASISNISYNKTIAYPSNGRIFQVKLKTLSDVTNTKDEPISRARVTLIDDRGNKVFYIENNRFPGTYTLNNRDFAAVFGVKYKLNIRIPSGEEFESSWETMPVETTEVGKISIEETAINKYIFGINSEKTIKNFEGIDVNIEMPKNNSEDFKYYRWIYKPIWIYIAPLARASSPVKKCWVTDNSYLGHQTLEKSKFSNYKNKLFFLQTTGNYKVYTYFSVLISQQVLSEGFYNFNKDLDKQGNRGGIFATPPFNLRTNYTCTKGDKSVYGYFEVFTENATRWVFDQYKLSYFITDDLLPICIAAKDIPAEPSGCESCIKIIGFPSTSPPFWWKPQRTSANKK